MPRRLAQQRMTLSDLECPFRASRAISAVSELIVCVYRVNETLGEFTFWIRTTNYT